MGKGIHLATQGRIFLNGSEQYSIDLIDFDFEKSIG